MSTYSPPRSTPQSKKVVDLWQATPKYCEAHKLALIGTHCPHCQEPNNNGRPMNLIGLVMMGVALIGCEFQYHVSRPYTSDQETAHDMYDCRQRSMKPTFGTVGGNMSGSIDPDWETYRLCLEGRGYTIKRD